MRVCPFARLRKNICLQAQLAKLTLAASTWIEPSLGT